MAASGRIRSAEPASQVPAEFHCPNCRHQFAPEAPDPCPCPQCSALCSRREGMYFVEVDLVPGVPPPMPPTPDERRRYQWIFWILFITTPLAVILLTGLLRAIVGWMPPGLRYFLGWIPESALPPLTILAVGSLAAGVCLTRLRSPRLAGWDLKLNALSWAVLLFLGFLGIALVGGTVKMLIR